MNLIEKIYIWFRNATSKPQEKGMSSAGYWQNKVREQILGLLSQCEGRLLELGCGEGLFLSHLGKADSRIQPWGIDCWRDALQAAKKRFAERKIKGIRLINSDAQKLPFKNEMFDVVVCANLFICVESVAVVRSIVQEAARVCRQNGTLIIEFRDKKNIALWFKYALARYYDTTTKNHPLSVYNYEGMASILKGAGFMVNKSREIDFPLKGMPVIFILEAKKVC